MTLSSFRNLTVCLVTTALLAGLGWRFNSGELFANLHYRIQLGLSAWVPFSNAQLDMSGESFRVQQPSYAITLGLTLGRFR